MFHEINDRWNFLQNGYYTWCVAWFGTIFTIQKTWKTPMRSVTKHSISQYLRALFNFSYISSTYSACDEVISKLLMSVLFCFGRQRPTNLLLWLIVKRVIRNRLKNGFLNSKCTFFYTDSTNCTYRMIERCSFHCVKHLQYFRR